MLGTFPTVFYVLFCACFALCHPALDAGSIPSRHPQPKAKRFGLGIHSDWIPVCAGMTRELDSRWSLPRALIRGWNDGKEKRE